MPATRKMESAEAFNAGLVVQDVWTYSKPGRLRKLEFWRQYSPDVFDNLLSHYPLVEIADLHPPAVIVLPDIDELNDWCVGSLSAPAVINRSRGTQQTALANFLVRTNRGMWARRQHQRS